MATQVHLSQPVGNPPMTRGIINDDVSTARWFLLGLWSPTNMRISSLYAAIKIDHVRGTCLLIGMRGEIVNDEFVYSGLSDSGPSTHRLPASIGEDENVRFVRYLREDEFVGMANRA